MATPVLYHIEVSHYNEKARWALDYKGVPHRRKAPMPMMHMAWAMAMTRGQGKTFPILKLNGDTVADSTKIIERLEHDYPVPPLYPDDPDDRRRALGWRSSSTRSWRRTSGARRSPRSRVTPMRSRGSPPRVPGKSCTPGSRARPRWQGRWSGMRYGINADTAAEGRQKTNRRLRASRVRDRAERLSRGRRLHGRRPHGGLAVLPTRAPAGVGPARTRRPPRGAPCIPRRAAGTAGVGVGAARCTAATVAPRRQSLPSCSAIVPAP